jgi:hypothetical protein
MQQPRITLQIGPQIHLPVDDLVQIDYRLLIIPAPEIQTRDLIIKDQDTMPVQIDPVFL